MSQHKLRTYFLYWPGRSTWRFHIELIYFWIFLMEKISELCNKANYIMWTANNYMKAGTCKSWNISSSHYGWSLAHTHSAEIVSANKVFWEQNTMGRLFISSVNIFLLGLLVTCCDSGGDNNIHFTQVWTSQEAQVSNNCHILSSWNELLFSSWLVEILSNFWKGSKSTDIRLHWPIWWKNIW